MPILVTHYLAFKTGIHSIKLTSHTYTSCSRHCSSRYNSKEVRITCLPTIDKIVMDFCAALGVLYKPLAVLHINHLFLLCVYAIFLSTYLACSIRFPVIKYRRRWLWWWWWWWYTTPHMHNTQPDAFISIQCVYVFLDLLGNSFHTLYTKYITIFFLCTIGIVL